MGYLPVTIVTCPKNDSIFNEKREVLACSNIINLLDFNLNREEGIFITSNTKLTVNSIAKGITLFVCGFDQSMVQATANFLNISPKGFD